MLHSYRGAGHQLSGSGFEERILSCPRDEIREFGENQQSLDLFEKMPRLLDRSTENPPGS